MIGVRVQDLVTNDVHDVLGDMVVNAAGPWANKVASMVGAHIPLVLGLGVHVIIGVRLTHTTLNRMRMPGSGDFMAPIRNQSVLGTTSLTVEERDYFAAPEDHIAFIREQGSLMVPSSARLPTIAITAAARPAIASDGTSEQGLSRTFGAFDHAARDNVEGFVTIAGGKMSTSRVMAEKIGDVVCHSLGVQTPCQTRTEPLVSYRRFYAG